MAWLRHRSEHGAYSISKSLRFNLTEDEAFSTGLPGER